MNTFNFLVTDCTNFPDVETSTMTIKSDTLNPADDIGVYIEAMEYHIIHTELQKGEGEENIETIKALAESFRTKKDYNFRVKYFYLLQENFKHINICISYLKGFTPVSTNQD